MLDEYIIMYYILNVYIKQTIHYNNNNFINILKI